MRNTRFPTRLEKEPIVDAVCEIQLSSSVIFSQVMPGVLFSKLDGEKSINQQPAAMIPSELRKQDPKLRFAPLTAIEWNGYTLSFSDYSLLIKCILPYPRWEKYKSVIEKVVNIILDSGIVTSISRLSVKYVDLVEGNTPEDRVSHTSVNLTINDLHLKNQSFQTQMEIIDNKENVVHIINIAAPAQMQDQDGQIVRTGTLITTDSIKLFDHETGIESFRNSFVEFLSYLHVENKKMFFSCLSNKGLDTLGPIYE